MQLLPAGWNHQHRTLAACISAYFCIRFAQVLVGAVVPGVIRTFSVSRSSVGLALTGMWVVYAVVQLPSGLAADRYGERPVVVASLALLGIATLGLAVAPVFQLFVVGLAVLGGAAGIYYNPATALLDRSSSRLGQTIGFHRVGAQAAGVVAPGAAAAVALRTGWRATVVLATVVTVIVAVVFVFGTSRTEPKATSTDERITAQLSSVLRGVQTLATTAMMTLVEFVGVASMAFIPVILLEANDLSALSANLLFALYFAVGAVSQPVVGRLSDRYGRDRTIVVLSGAGVVGYGGLTTASSIPLTGATIVLAGVAMSSTPVIQSRMLDGLSAADRGAGFGAFRTVYLLLGASGAAVVGTIADVSGWETATGLVGLCFLVILVLAIAADPVPME